MVAVCKNRQAVLPFLFGWFRVCGLFLFCLFIFYFLFFYYWLTATVLLSQAVQLVT